MRDSDIRHPNIRVSQKAPAWAIGTRVSGLSFVIEAKNSNLRPLISNQMGRCSEGLARAPKGSSPVIGRHSPTVRERPFMAGTGGSESGVLRPAYVPHSTPDMALVESRRLRLRQRTNHQEPSSIICDQHVVTLIEALTKILVGTAVRADFELPLRTPRRTQAKTDTAPNSHVHRSK